MSSDKTVRRPIEVPPEFRQSVSSGRAVVVLGGLWDEGGSSTTGLGLYALRRDLLSIAGAEDAVEDLTFGLPEAHRAATQFTSETAAAAVARRLAIPDDLVETYRRIINGPWERVYEIAAADLSRVLEPGVKAKEAAITDGTCDYEIRPDRTQVIQLCGSAAQPVGVDFSVPNGSGVSPRDRWFMQLCADIVARPLIVIVGNQFTEHWGFLIGRDGGTRAQKSVGFFLSGRLRPVDRLRIDRFDLEYVDADPVQLATTFFASSVAETSDGHRALARLRNVSAAGGGAQLVGALLRDRKLTWGFLQGHDPRWADVAADRLVRLSRTKAIYDARGKDGQQSIVLLKGRAGDGKTSALMRMAVELEGKGHTCVWVDRLTSHGLSTIAQQVEALEPDAVFIDDIDMFGERSSDFARRINRSGKVLVVASVRSSKIGWLGSTASFQIVNGETPLTDADLKGLIGKLTEAGLLGALTGVRPESARVDRLRELSQRDLLAGLIQVVTGQPFERRVQSEYEQLSSITKNIYACMCFGASGVYETAHVVEEDLLQIAGGTPPYADARAAVEELVESKLIRREPFGLRARHRAIADAVVRSLSRDKIGDIVRSMLLFYASRAGGIRDPAHPDRRQMISLLSHSHMKDLKLRSTMVRSIYADVQPLLSDDFHYWLQRGAYEVEHNNLDLADSYLESARGCEGGARDFKVITEWGFMHLKKAEATPGDVQAQAGARAAIVALEQVARSEGRNSPHTFTILVRHGVRWIETASLSDADRLRFAGLIDDLRALGITVCGDNREFARAARDVERKLAVLKGTASPRYPLP